MGLRKEILGSIINFVPAGTMIDDGSGGQVAVSKTVKPASSIGAWESLGCTKEVKFDKKTTTDTVMCFNPETRKWEEEEEEIVLADYTDVTVKDHTPLVWKLLFGIKSDIPTDGTTAVTPYEEQIREVYGWVQHQVVNTRDKVDRTVVDCWVKITLKTYPSITEKTVLPELRYQMLHSTLNGQTFMANL